MVAFYSHTQRVPPLAVFDVCILKLDAAALLDFVDALVVLQGVVPGDVVIV